MGEIQNLTKHIDFKNLIYHFKGKVVQKVLSVKGPLAFSQKYEKQLYNTRKSRRKTNKNQIRYK